MKITPVVLRLTAIATAVVLVTSAPALAATKPSAPQSPSATPGDTTVTLRWTKSSLTGGEPIDHYSVQQYYGAAWHTIKTTRPGVRMWTHTALTNGSPYTYRIKAHNSIGWSRPSTTVIATPRTTATAPRFVIVAKGDSSATLTWQAPSSDGGAPIDSYSVERSEDGASFGAEVSVSDLDADVTGLTPGTRYWFRVRAHNAAGYGASTGVGPLDALTVPSAPEWVGIDNSKDPELGELYLNWLWSAGPGAPLEKFQVQYSTDENFDSDSLWFGPYAFTTNVKLSELEVGTEYWVRVRAMNEIGWSAWASGGPYIPAPNPPSAPQSLTATRSQTGANVEWAAPADNGGAAIDIYEVEVVNYYDDGGYQDFGTASTSLGVTGLTVGQTYRVRVRAHNTGGTWGPWTAYVPFYMTDLSP